MKKIISLILALTMVFALAVTASAVTVTINPGDNAPDGATTVDQTYYAYKIFDASVSGDNVSYTISEDNQFYTSIVQFAPNAGPKVFTLTEIGDTGVFNVAVADSFNDENQAKQLADILKTHATTDAIESTKNVLSGLDSGYYLITSSLGTALIVDTFSGDVTITTKNEFPSIEKSIVKVNNQAITATDSYTAKIGDVITFELKVTIPATANVDSKIVLHDYMDASLSAGNANPFWGDPDSPFADNEHTWNGGHDMAFTKMGELTITSDMLGDTVTATYTATLNSNAVIGGAGNKNKAWIEYENYTSEEDEVTVYTYGFDLNKTNDTGTTITGAEFYLSKSSTHPDADGTAEQNLITFTNSGSVYTTDAGGYSSFEVRSYAKIQAGSVQIRGLAEGTYYLHEVKAPDGYNKLEDPVVIVVSKDGITQDGVAVSDLTVNVINETGTVLPSTGGMGTTLFYVLGSLMAVTALVVLVTNKRMRT